MNDVSPNDDDILERAALEVERFSIDEVLGLMARRKRAREDAALRSSAIRKTRAECAAKIRALKSDQRSDPVRVLERVNQTDAHDHLLSEAWPLAWEGLVDIECTITCNSNSIPPVARFRIVLTDKGRALLGAHK